MKHFFLPSMETLGRMGRKAKLNTILFALKMAKKVSVNEIPLIFTILGGMATVSSLIALGYFAPATGILASLLLGKPIAKGFLKGAGTSVEMGESIKRWIDESIANVKERLEYPSDEEMEAEKKARWRQSREDRRDHQQWIDYVKLSEKAGRPYSPADFEEKKRTGELFKYMRSIGWKWPGEK